MPRVELIYFGDCPNVDKARAAIRAGGINDIVETNQDLLKDGDPRSNYSSPTILLDGAVVAGISDGGSTCSLVEWDRISAIIAGANVE